MIKKNTYSKITFVLIFILSIFFFDVKKEDLKSNTDFKKSVTQAKILSKASQQSKQSENNDWKTQTVQSEQVKAIFSYNYKGKLFCYRESSLKILRSEKIYINESPEQVLSKKWMGVSDCNFRYGGLDIQDLDGDREPEIILNLHTGGNKCCYLSLIYGYNVEQDRYDAISHFFAQSLFQKEDIDRDGILEFNGFDDSTSNFFGFFTSTFPKQIWQYRQGKMHLSNQCFPQEISNVAESLWQKYLELRSKKLVKQGDSEEELEEWGISDTYVTVILAAYLANKYSLNQGEDGWQQLREFYHWRDREEFFGILQNFLEKRGYMPQTHPQKIDMPSDMTEINVSGGVFPGNKKRYLLKSFRGKHLVIQLKDLEQGVVDIAVRAPDGQLIGTINRSQPSWQKKLIDTGKYELEVFSPSGAGYVMGLQVF
ncbi:hypothetical protein IQ249_16100 [Lusitaniella coriacea LEGE 07157]|uniref:Uncharacterized protein n=1 Tax=Lusitaniella coriacea LEGE 07157 TaxID=945747 RepID=A0A8J7DZL0_9CYAN|nr:hypothetical protein [Lusitaniella coriacea]MBE9117423.1 hypothetical protein [Lusitaniella coriacea LEGE 07157]